jgi:hypothetical protein
MDLNAYPILIGVTSAGMSVEIATAMVGAAVLSVLLFPAAAQALLSRNTPTPTTSAPSSQAAANPPISVGSIVLEFAWLQSVQIPLDPPFSKGEFSSSASNPSLQKRGRGDFSIGMEAGIMWRTSVPDTSLT